MKSVTKKEKNALLADWGRIVSASQVAHLQSLGHGFLEMERDGSTVSDESGTAYIDCLTSSGIHNLGRRRPEIATALRAGARATDQGNFPMISREKGDLAERIAKFVGGALECSVYSVVRGESIDFACKLARGATGRKELLAVDGSHFGQTGFAMSLSARPDKDAYGPLIPETGSLPLSDLEAVKSKITRKTAAVFVEPVQAETGGAVPSVEYLRALREQTRAVGALLVLDETQTGLGRTGRKFAYQHADVEPDMLVIGEALGAGIFPIAATVITQKLNEFMNAHPLIHLSTFGGSDLGCVVARHALDLYDELRPWENAAERGVQLAEGLAKIAKGAKALGGVSGLGLLQVVDAKTADKAAGFCKALAENSVVGRPG